MAKQVEFIISCISLNILSACLALHFLPLLFSNWFWYFSTWLCSLTFSCAFKFVRSLIFLLVWCCILYLTFQLFNLTFYVSPCFTRFLHMLLWACVGHKNCRLLNFFLVTQVVVDSWVVGDDPLSASVFAWLLSISDMLALPSRVFTAPQFSLFC